MGGKNGIVLPTLNKSPPVVGLSGSNPQVAEIFTGTPGAFVDLETTINDFEEVPDRAVSVCRELMRLASDIWWLSKKHL